MEKPENYISINEIQRMKLCNELAQLTYEIRQNKHVQCIYFAPYKDLGSIKGNVVNITVVSDLQMPPEFDIQYRKRISRKEQLNQFGVKIYINHAHKDGYTDMPINPSERSKGNDIFNSTILFDRTGAYTKIKEDTEKVGVGEQSNLFYYDNLAEILPPIEDSLEYSMESEAIKIMNKAMKN